nr:TlpA family protein disulfide reductase [Actinomycetales bacterium]
MSRATRALATAAATLALLVSGCASIGNPDGAAGAGYQAGDGSFVTWGVEERGEPVELVGESYEGEVIDLDQWRGDVVVMNFWYAACPPCRAEAPDLVALHEEYPDIHLLGVNPRDDAGAAQAFERTFEIPYPSLWDQDASGVAAMQGLVPLQAMPTTVILDREGRVASRILGQADPTILRGLVDDVVAEVGADEPRGGA